MAEKDGAYVPPLFLHEHQRAMNQLFTSTSRVLAALLFVALTTESAAQSFPLPYNPDENGDGLIGVADLQGLLSNYGSEFSSAVLSEDGESAITYMGEMAYPLCTQACKNLPGMWRLADFDDLGLVWEEITSQSSSQTWVDEMDRVNGATGVNSSSSLPVAVYYHRQTNQTPGLRGDYGGDDAKRCYCAARQLPRVEYTYCEGTDIQECANEQVEAGWYPLEGITKISYNGQNKIQAFWRWAE